MAPPLTLLPPPFSPLPFSIRKKASNHCWDGTWTLGRASRKLLASGVVGALSGTSGASDRSLADPLRARGSGGRFADGRLTAGAAVAGGSRWLPGGEGRGDEAPVSRRGAGFGERGDDGRGERGEPERMERVVGTERSGGGKMCFFSD